MLEFALSDHTAQLLQCPIPNICSTKYWYTTRRDYSYENILKFKNCINSLKFSDIYLTDNPNVAYNEFMSTFKLFYDLCFPLKKIKINVIKKPKWLSRGVKLCSKKKRKLLWQRRLNPTHENKRNFSTYSKLYNKIINLTQKAQNNYRIKQSNNKSKTSWQVINQSKYNMPKRQIEKLKVSNKVINKPLDIANAFNDHFVDKVHPKIDADYKPKGHRPSINQKSMFMAPSTPYDINKIIMSLKNTNSVGIDDIATKVLKAVSAEICGHLSHIINLSICSGIFPEALKTSIIKPLFKKEDKELMENYRPISLIPVISKVFEKYIYKELYNYIEKKKHFMRRTKRI